jgi:hypothetical protein
VARRDSDRDAPPAAFAAAQPLATLLLALVVSSERLDATSCRKFDSNRALQITISLWAIRLLAPLASVDFGESRTRQK